MADVFVSYASEDRDRIRPLVEALEARGWSVWWDRELVTGPSFDTAIESALDAARCVVVAWSRHSVDSRWVRAEANEGLERNVLVPARIDDVRPPLAFRTSQTADLTGWPASSDGLVSLLEGVAGILGVGAEPQTAAAAPARSIAVLPFANMTSDPEQEYFGDGIAEEVISGLVNWGGCKVIARTSSFKFKGQNEDIRRIAEVLGVTHVLEGSVRKAGNRLRVTAQLIDAGDGTQLWSERFDREAADVFELQDDITASIIRALKGELATGARPARGTRATEAYEAYVSGRYHLAQGSTLPTYLAAMKALRRAVEVDPEFADAHGALSTAYFGLGFWNAPARMDLIEAEVGAALALDPQQPDAQLTDASLLLYRDHDIHGAIEAWEAIIAARPTDVLAMYRLYIGLMTLGANDIGLLDRLVELDPLYQTHYRHRAACHLQRGRLDEALRDAERALEMDGSDVFAISMRARVATERGDAALLADALDRIKALVGERSTFYARLTDDKALAREILEDPESVKRNPPMNLANLSCWLGDYETGMRWFARAMERGDFAAIQQCRMWMRSLFDDAATRESQYALIAARDDYQAIMRNFRLDDESVADLLERYATVTF